MARIVPSLVIVGFIYLMNSYEIAPGIHAGIPVPGIIFLAIALAGVFITQNTTLGVIFMRSVATPMLLASPA